MDEQQNKQDEGTPRVGVNPMDSSELPQDLESQPNAVVPDQASQQPLQPADNDGLNKAFMLFGLALALVVVAGVMIFVVSRGGDPEPATSTSVQTSDEFGDNDAVTLTDDEKQVVQLSAFERDAQRRADVGRFMVAAETYASNNNGIYPPEDDLNDDIVDDYLSGDFDDPQSGDAYDFTTSDPEIGEIQYQLEALCDGTDMIAGSSNRDIAARVQLESGNHYCQDNS